MFKVGSKLNFKKQECLVEIIGVFPCGQVGLVQNEYSVIINGAQFRLNQQLLDLLFVEVDKNIFFVQKEVKEVVQNSEPVEEVIEEVVQEPASDSEPEIMEEEKEVKRRGRPARKGE